MNKNRKLIRVVDDDNSLRKAITFFLETEGWEVASYSNAHDFLVSDAPSVLGCLILDVAMPQMNGLELYEEMKLRKYKIPVIFLTGHGDIDMAVQAMKDGAVDFLQKPVDEDRLLQAVAKAVSWDESHRGWVITAEEEIRRFESLTKREKEILGFVAKGMVNKDIAERLGLSDRTIEVHRQNGARKLGVQTPSEIAKFFAHLKAD